jgi:hypothetical protein
VLVPVSHDTADADEVLAYAAGLASASGSVLCVVSIAGSLHWGTVPDSPYRAAVSVPSSAMAMKCSVVMSD